jgi:D-xylose transport system substrate-binding protein
MTIYKPIKALAGRAAEVAVAMARRAPVIAGSAVNNDKIDVPSILLEVVTVTRDNLDATVIADDFLSRDAIYGRHD